MKKLQSVFLVIFYLVFFYCSFNILLIRRNNYVEQQKIVNLQQELTSKSENTNIEIPLPTISPFTQFANSDISSSDSESIEETQPKILAKYEELYSQNTDLYGWISIEGTAIDYPVMQTVDEQNYYLRKNWNRKYSLYGLPFVDAQVTSSSNNIIIYGHNMRDSSMFGDLEKYKDQNFYEKYKYIKFDTLYEESTYEIISVVKTIAYYTLDEIQNADYYFYSHIALDSEEEFNEFITKIKENSYFDTGVTAEYGDKLLTLSTCDYWVDDARLLVIAKKVQ